MLQQPSAAAPDAGPAHAAHVPVPALARRQALKRGAGWALLGLEGLALEGAGLAVPLCAGQAGWGLAAAASTGLGLATQPAQGAALQELARPMPAELQEALPAAQALGAARLRFLGLDIYQARLWAGAGFDANNYAQSPFALELNYARSLSGRLIAERALKEMRRQASLQPQQEAAWLAALVAAIPDVQAGDRITGLHLPAQGARFWFNGQPRPGVPDAAFSRLFFGIWLSEASSEPQLRAELLGRSS